ncbi:PH domain-containing protein [Oceanicella sp. SM1341]|uniref:PH domain-containing protein n=1 Tax=Oceanicella sp. SM1341 TaxID=1548889 RepID=UPI000E47F1DD|nr:PH domain-containing protein [Oceanicella sp. SM1341]
MTLALLAAALAAIGLLAGLALWQAAKDRDAAPAPLPGGGFEARPSAALLPVAAALALSGVSFAAGALGGRGAGEAAVLGGLALICALGAGLAWHRRGLRLRYDAEGLTRLSPGGRREHWPWSALCDIRIETRRPASALAPTRQAALVARTRAGETVRIGSALRGFGHLAAHAIAIAEASGTRAPDREI